jgi:hypothetical protein
MFKTTLMHFNTMCYFVVTWFILFFLSLYIGVTKIHFLMVHFDSPRKGFMLIVKWLLCDWNMPTYNHLIYELCKYFFISTLAKVFLSGSFVLEKGCKWLHSYYWHVLMIWMFCHFFSLIRILCELQKTNGKLSRIL